MLGDTYQRRRNIPNSSSRFHHTCAGVEGTSISFRRKQPGNLLSSGRAAGGRLTQNRSACERIGDTETAGRPPGQDSPAHEGSGSSAGDRCGPGAVSTPVPSLWSLNHLPLEQPGLLAGGGADSSSESAGIRGSQGAAPCGHHPASAP